MYIAHTPKEWWVMLYFPKSGVATYYSNWNFTALKFYLISPHIYSFTHLFISAPAYIYSYVMLDYNTILLFYSLDAQIILLPMRVMSLNSSNLLTYYVS